MMLEKSEVRSSNVLNVHRTLEEGSQQQQQQQQINFSLSLDLYLSFSSTEQNQFRIPGISNAERARLLNFVVVGGGPTGVEVLLFFNCYILCFILFCDLFH
jgi:NADH dehydrogenase FAD-containing subunit